MAPSARPFSQGLGFGRMAKHHAVHNMWVQHTRPPNIVMVARGSKRGTRRRRADEDYGWITRILVPTLRFLQTTKTQDTYRLRNSWLDSKRQQ